MKAIARRATNSTFSQQLTIRDHSLVADESVDDGGEDLGASPQELLAASLASCVAVTMEMYAQRKGWDIGQVVVECEYEPAPRGYSTFFNVTLHLPEHITAEQRARLEAIAARCPVHRTLEGPVRFKQRTELTSES
jgi:putative redox protein